MSELEKLKAELEEKTQRIALLEQRHEQMMVLSRGVDHLLREKDETIRKLKLELEERRRLLKSEWGGEDVFTN